MKDEKLYTKLDAGVEEIKELLMTAKEKELVLKNILSASLLPVERPIVSPYRIMYSFMSKVHKNRLVYYGSLSCLIVILGSSIVFASGGTLPGDTLYPLKVKVVEPLNGALTFSHEAKIAYETDLAVERLVEAETLADENKLDAKKEEELNSLLESHTNAFNEAVDKFRQSGSVSDGVDDNIITNFQANMNAHAQILDVLTERDTTRQATNNSKISKTARDNATKARSNLESKGNQKPENYNARKNVVQSLIDKTAIDAEGTNSETSSKRQVIFNNSQKTLDQARQFLKDADEEDQKGDSTNSFGKLLDSESSAKEAGILLKTGLYLKLK